MREYKNLEVKGLEENGFLGSQEKTIQINITTCNIDKLLLLFGNSYNLPSEEGHHWQHYWQVYFEKENQIINIISSQHSTFIFGNCPKCVGKILLEVGV
jgi:hypothetical protein